MKNVSNFVDGFLWCNIQKIESYDNGEISHRFYIKKTRNYV